MSFPLIDILIVLVLLCFLFVGLFKGFWRSLFALCSSLLTIVLAILLSKPLSGLLQNWFQLSDAFASTFHGGIESYVNEHGYTSGWMAQAMNIIMGKDYMQHVTDQTVLVNDFSFKLGTIANVLVCIVILYILLRIALFFLSKLLKKITERGVMKGVDKSLGVVFGLVKGCVVIFMAFFVIFELSSFITPIGDWFNSALTTNRFTGVLYGWSKTIIEDVIMPFITR